MFNIGEEVMINENFWEYRYDNDPGVNDEMREYAGETFIVKEYYSKGIVRLKGTTWLWDERWLTSLSLPCTVTEDGIMNLLNDIIEVDSLCEAYQPDGDCDKCEMCKGE